MNHATKQRALDVIVAKGAFRVPEGVSTAGVAADACAAFPNRKATGDALLGFRVCEVLARRGKANVGCDKIRYCGGEAQVTFLVSSLLDDPAGEFESAVAGSFNAHTVADMLEAVVASVYRAIEHHRLGGLPAAIRWVDTLCERLIDFWDAAAAPAAPPTLAYSDESTEYVSALLVAARDESWRRQEEAARRLDELAKARAAAEAKHADILQEIDLREAEATAAQKAAAVDFATEAQGHRRAPIMVKWVTRRKNELRVRIFPCCGQLAIGDDATQVVVSKRPCNGAPDQQHGGRVVNARDTYKLVLKASPPALWSCCGAVVVSVQSAPTVYLLHPEAPCGCAASVVDDIDANPLKRARTAHGMFGLGFWATH